MKRAFLIACMVVLCGCVAVAADDPPGIWLLDAGVTRVHSRVILRRPVVKAPAARVERSVVVKRTVVPARPIFTLPARTVILRPYRYVPDGGCVGPFCR